MEKGYFDNLKYITLDFTPRKSHGRGKYRRLGWTRESRLMSETYRFFTNVDMARRHGIKGSDNKRCIRLRELTIIGVALDENTEDAFRFWFAGNVRFVKEVWSLGSQHHRIPSVSCLMNEL